MIYEIDARRKAGYNEILSGHLKMGGKNSEGQEININSLYITLDGNPWLPVMGEFHFSRFPSEYWEEELLKIKACGVGCVLIHKDVLEKVSFRYDKTYVCFDDMFFCDDAVKNGFDIYVDASVKCKHLVMSRKEEDSWAKLKR